jgi:uncharacterized membrane protein YoaK (UPF0700 family)
VKRFRLLGTSRNFLTLLLVAWTGGATDAISYAGLGHVFAANMTGHTVLLALSFTGLDGLSPIRGVLALAAYIAGVALGWVAIARFCVGDRQRRGLQICMLIELGLLLLLAIAWPVMEIGVEWQRFPMIALAGLAMGVQSAGVLSLGMPGISTTYITGLYTQLTANLVDWLRPFSREPAAEATSRHEKAKRLARTEQADLTALDSNSSTSPRPSDSNSSQSPESASRSASSIGATVRLQITVLVAYAAGAIVGGLSILLFRPFAPLVPLTALFVAAISLSRARR